MSQRKHKSREVDGHCMECAGHEFRAERLRAENADMKARLKEARAIHGWVVLRNPYEERLARVLDRRVKNWRNP